MLSVVSLCYSLTKVLAEYTLELVLSYEEVMLFPGPLQRSLKTIDLMLFVCYL